MITIFTPTYNRADYIGRVYQSLAEQADYNFEWIIVDDDSVDGTEEVIKTFLEKENPFPIVYKKQLHGGKHRAINCGVEIAKGEYFFIVDSDDYLLPNAVELLHKWGDEIKDDDSLAGVSGMRIYPDGEVIGGEPAIKLHHYVNCTLFEQNKYKIFGDKAEMYKTGILKKYPFPEYEGEYFLAEGCVWGRIAADGYKIRWYHEPLYVAEYLPDGLSRTGNIQRVIDNFQGYCDALKVYWKHDSWFNKMNGFWNFNRAAHAKKIPLHERNKCISVRLSEFYFHYLIGLPVFLPFKIYYNVCAGKKFGVSGSVKRFSKRPKYAR